MDALPALRFFLSIGLAIRPYAQADVEWASGPWPQLVNDLGIWSVRGKVVTFTEQLRKLKGFYAKGGTQCFTVVAQDGGIDKAATANNINFLADHFPGTQDPILMQGKLNISGFESANELNHTLTAVDTGIALRDLQPFIKQTIEGSAKLAGLPCVGPSIWNRDDATYAQVGSLEPNADIWCLHYYNEGRIPTISGLSDSPNLLEAVADARQIVPNGPGFFTEMGNKSAFPDVAYSADKLSGRAQSKYALRCYFDYFFNPTGGGTQTNPRGAEKNFMYNGVDDQPLHWGMMTGAAPLTDVRTGLTVPPYTRRDHFYAIQRLLNKFRDFTVNPTGNTVVPVLPRLANYALENVIAGSIPITFGPTPAGFRSWLFRRADNGKFILVLYRDIESWKRTSPFGDVNPTDVDVVVTFGSSRTFRVYHPTFDDVVKQSGTASSATIGVADHVVLVEIDSVAGPVATAVSPLNAAQANKSTTPTVASLGAPSPLVTLSSAGQAHNASAPILAFTPAATAAPITFVGSGAAARFSTATSYSFSSLLNEAGAVPTLKPGDMVVLTIAYRTATAGIESPVAGPLSYTELFPNIYANGPANDVNLRGFYKFMGAAPDTGVTVPEGPGPGAVAYAIHVLRNVDPNSPLDVPTVARFGPGALTMDAGPITPVSKGAMIYVAGGSAGATGVPVATNPANLSQTPNHFAANASSNVTVGAGLKTDWASGAFDPDPFGGGNVASGGSGAAATVALRQGSAPAPIEYQTCWDGSVIPVTETCPPQPPPPTTQAPVQSLHTGHVTASSVMVTVKMEGSAQGTASSIRLVASTSPQLTNPIYSAVSQPELDAFRISKITLSSLLANTQYYYGVEVEGVIDPVRGRFKTLPSGAQVSMRFAVASCTDPLLAIYASYSAMLNLANRPLFMMNIGDFHYENVWTTNGVSTTEAHHHAALDKVFTIPVRNQFMREIPTMLQWDDHDFGGNDLTGRTDANVLRDGTGPANAYARRRWPQPQANATAGQALYFSFVVGRVRFIVSDLRTYKTGRTAVDDASKTMMGTTQKTWFKAEIDAAAAGSQAVVWANAQPFRSPIHANDDDWGSYHTERKELLDYMKTAGMSGKVLVVIGDMHSSARWTGDMLAAYTTTGENGMNVTVWHVGPMENDASYKGGPYDAIYPAQGSTAIQQMYNLIDVAENSDGSLSLTHTVIDAGVSPNVQRLAASNVWTPLAGRPQIVSSNSAQAHAAQTPTAVFVPRPNPLPANSLQAHNATPPFVSFTPRPAPAPVNAAHAHSSTTPSIASVGPVGTVGVSSPLQAHNSSSPLVTFSAVPAPAPENAAQAHSSAVLTITFYPIPNYTLTAGNAAQAHNASVSTLGFTPAPPVPPVNLIKPVITVPAGGPVVGAVVRGSDGGWDSELTAIAYQWRAGGVVAALGQTSGFVITTAELGKTLTFDVIGTSIGGTTTATSLPTETVTAVATPPPAAEPTPVAQPETSTLVIPRLPLTRESKERMKRDLRGRKLTRGQIAQAYRVSLSTVFWVELEMFFYG